MEAEVGEKRDHSQKKYQLLKWCHFSAYDKLKELKTY